MSQDFKLDPKKLDMEFLRKLHKRTLLPPGGYICKINYAEDTIIQFDICEGEYTGYFERLSYLGCMGYGIGMYVLHSSQMSLDTFASFIVALEDSNEDFTYDGKTMDNDDEDHFEYDMGNEDMDGKVLGIVYSYEEYIDDDGNVKMNPKIAHFTSVDNIRSGNYRLRSIQRVNKKHRKKFIVNEKEKRQLYYSYMS